MEDNDLIIEIDDNRDEIAEKSAQMLLAFIIARFNGKKICFDEITHMIVNAGGPEFMDLDISQCINNALLRCNDPDMEDWVVYHVKPYITLLK